MLITWVVAKLKLTLDTFSLRIWDPMIRIIKTQKTKKPKKSKKPEKIHPEKNSLYFRKWNFLALILKKFFYFRKWNLALSGLNPHDFSLKIPGLKKFLIFSYISGNGNLHFSIQAQEIKKAIQPFLYFRKEKLRKNFLYFLKRKLFLCFGKQLSELEKWKNPALKNFLYFKKWDFSTPSIKNYCFLGEPFRVFHQCFFRCSDFTVDFYYCLLIAFVHSITVSSGVFISPLVLLLFFECFHFTNFLYRDWVLSGTSFLRCCTASATNLRELFLLSIVFYLTLLPNIRYNLLFYQAFPWADSYTWKVVVGSPTETQSICLFKSHSVQ